MHKAKNKRTTLTFSYYFWKSACARAHAFWCVNLNYYSIKNGRSFISACDVHIYMYITENTLSLCIYFYFLFLFIHLLVVILVLLLLLFSIRSFRFIIFLNILLVFNISILMINNEHRFCLCQEQYIQNV